jgi:hypothetical protein
MKLPPNWKTSLSGILVAFSGYVTFDPDSFGGNDAPIVKFCTYITLGGLASLGIFISNLNCITY